MGWVGNELVDQKEGDLQALEKLLPDVRGENSKDSIVHGRTFKMDAQGDGPGSFQGSFPWQLWLSPA